MIVETSDTKLQEIPEIDNEIFEAAGNGELVLFVGAGVSGLLGCPSWGEFGKRILNHLHSHGALTYAEIQALSELEVRKQLSISIGIASKKQIALEAFRELQRAFQESGVSKEEILREIDQERLARAEQRNK